MPALKPSKTVADYLVVGFSPLLIMLLVGSLCFFLIEVFFRGEAVGSVRWVMFWFVLAVVLVSRIGIEEGKDRAAAYGLALAAATWLYLVRIHPAFILGMILLGIVWWCAHKLTWDCTLIDEDEDASGGGLLETASDRKNFLPSKTKRGNLKPAKAKGEPPPAKPQAPGLWVVYFSLAALPLFGIGQMLLPRDDLAARHAGFSYLFIYMAAALGLLLTTSFLGLRRYLRQRYLEMPPMIAFGWIRFGAGVAAFVLIGALLLPRPGANEAWQTLHYQIDHQLRQASGYATRFSPHGKGQGQAGNETQKTEPPKNPTADSQPQAGPGKAPSPGPGGNDQSQDGQPPQPHTEEAGPFYHWFKVLFLLALAGLAGWWLFRRRDLILQITRSVVAAITQFFKDLLRLGSSGDQPVTAAQAVQTARRRPFAAYPNPFLTGKDAAWTQEELVLYSFEALRAWADEQEAKLRPEQTAREFCDELGNRFPEIISDLSQLSFLYGHAAYGGSVPAAADLEPVKKLWRFLSVQLTGGGRWHTRDNRAAATAFVKFQQEGLDLSGPGPLAEIWLFDHPSVGERIDFDTSLFSSCDWSSEPKAVEKSSGFQ